MIKHVKLLVLKKLFIWWVNEHDGGRLRGTTHHFDKVIDTLLKSK